MMLFPKEWTRTFSNTLYKFSRSRCKIPEINYRQSTYIRAGLARREPAAV